jgi:anaerobic selenocysteine-containing dehydrogenase
VAKITKRVVCEHCHARCRIAVHVEDGELKGLEEDRTYPLWDRIYPPTRGCARLLGAREMLNHPDRVDFPLKRVGERGEGRWKRISWDDALDEIGGKLNEIRGLYGPESLAFTTGTWRTRNFEGRFCNLFGTPNIIGQGKICFGPFVQTAAAMFGWPLRPRTAPRLADDSTGQKTAAKCILLTGIDPSQSVLRLWKSLRDAKQMGYKIIVLDPRETQTAKLADIWLQLRPGTDTALLMAMLNVVIEEGLYDKEFAEKWCYGFEKVRERAKEYTPEKAAAITWIPAERIREAARLCGNSRPLYTLNGMGTEHLQNAIEAIHARLILASITGSIDVEGGHFIPGPPRCRMYPDLEESGRLSADRKAKQIGSDRFKFQGWPGFDMILENTIPVWGKAYSIISNQANAHAPAVYRAMLTGEPYPVRAAITQSSNPMVTQANTKLVYKALKSLDLYVVLDLWRTPSAELADYILPIASWLEKPSLMVTSDTAFYGGEEAFSPTIEGKRDRRTDYDVLRGLGMRVGQEKDWPWKGLEEAFDYMLEPIGVRFQEFMDRGGYEIPPDQYRKHEKLGFATKTGKVELYSTVLERLGYDPLPKYEEPFETPLSRPDLAREYPLMLITGGRFLPMYHSEHRQIDFTREKHPHPLVQINRETAKGLGIEDGDWVWIETPRGRIRQKCVYFDGIDPRVVHCEHGWWFPELPGEEPWLSGAWESNVNVLTDDALENCGPISGIWPLKTALCKVYRAKVY